MSESATGRAVLAEEEDARAALLQEGRSLDRAFEAEERALTDQRATMSPQAFRPLADAFDEKVVATRRAQEQKALTLTREAEERRRAFFANVTPILLQILRETGAAAVVDQRSILISKQDLNITEEVIKRLDQRIDEEAPDVPPGAQDD